MRLKLITLIVAVLVFPSVAIAQAESENKKLPKLDAEHMLGGYFFAASRTEDPDALGGFAPSENFPRPIESSMNVPADMISIIVYPDSDLPFRTFRGIRVVIVNSTSGEVGFFASDSRLYVVQEAVDDDGFWKPIEYLPSSWCGNSYHTVFLPSREYWEFASPRYTGKLPTRLRFRLDIAGVPNKQGKPKPVYSNEFHGSVKPKQFRIQEGHKPTSLMDPYNN